MENRKLIIFVPILLGFFVFGTLDALAYGVENHAFLTSELVDFYNKNFSKKIPDNLKIYLIDGARQEDNFPRYANHFYDPVNDRGLADGIYKGQKSKTWAQDPKSQTALLYKIMPRTVATLLTADQLSKIEPIYNKTNFSWQKAIDLYANGETEQAMYALGHVLHLIEDSSVPDHTRNDAHPPFDHGGSPFENWAHEITLENPDTEIKNRLWNKKPILLDSLDEYFDGIANYSNNNFYSRDSIKNYELPEPDYFRVEENLNYGFKKDKEFGDYRLAIFTETIKKFNWKNDKEEIIGITDNKEDLPLKDYWNRLSVKAIQYGAGVIDLFFKEAEAAKAKLELEKARRPFLGTLMNGFRAIFGGGGVEQSGNLIAQVPIKKKAIDERKPPKKEDLISPIKPISQIETESVVGEPIPTEIVALQLCGFDSGGALTRNGVILNEIAWMGTSANASDEWIELREISGYEADLSGWQLLSKSGNIEIVFDSGAKIAPAGFFLLERSDDNTVPAVAADQIFKGAIKNDNDGLRLFNKNCNLIDEVLANSKWPAGDNASKNTMERRVHDFSWYNSTSPGGTPKAHNSEPVAFYSVGTSSSAKPAEPEENQNQPSPQPSAKILISEIQAATDAGGAEDEFVELYNPNDQSVDLTGWSLKKKSSTGSESNLISSAAFSGIIAPQSFFLIAHINYQESKTPDLIYSANSNNLAHTVNNSAVLYDANGAVIDEASWSEISKDQSIERRALQNGNCVSAQNDGELLGNGCDTDSQSDFENRAVPNPQNTDDLPEPRAIGGADESIEDTPVELPSTYISSAVFSRDAGGDFVSFILYDNNETNNRFFARYIMVWLNQDPAAPTIGNRASGFHSNYAGGGCPTSGFVGEGTSESNGGTGFDYYGMPELELVPPASSLPPIYDRSQAPYRYKVYLEAGCPNPERIPESFSETDFITVGLWFYHVANGTIWEEDSTNYPEKHYFRP